MGEGSATRVRVKGSKGITVFYFKLTGQVTPLELGRLQYKHVEPIAGFQKSVKKIVYPPLKQCEKMFYPPLNKVKIILYPPSPPLLQKIFLSDFLGPKCLYYKLSI